VSVKHYCLDTHTHTHTHIYVYIIYFGRINYDTSVSDDQYRLNFNMRVAPVEAAAILSVNNGLLLYCRPRRSYTNTDDRRSRVAANERRKTLSRLPIPN